MATIRSVVRGCGYYLPERVVTNIVIFDVADAGLDAATVSTRLAKRNVLAAGSGTSIRMVTHYDVSRADIESALAALRGVLKER